MVTPTTLRFLTALRKHNDRTWFEAHKSEYLAAKENVTALADAIHMKLSETDVIADYRVYRIYRDVRFSKDKTPYKEHLDGYFYRAGAERRGGYVFRIAPGNSQVGGGFFGPERDDLLRIRQEWAFDSEPITQITQHSDFVKSFGTLQGDELKTAPQGFPRDHPNIAWLRKKQFYVLRSFTDEAVTHPDFVAQAVQTYHHLRPFLDYMSEILSTNADGETL